MKFVRFHRFEIKAIVSFIILLAQIEELIKYPLIEKKTKKQTLTSKEQILEAI